MVGYGQVTLGTIFLIIAILLFVGTGWVIYTYFDGVDTIEEEKEDRDRIKSFDGDTTEIDEVIKDHEDTLNFKRNSSVTCSVLSLIFLVFGVFLIFRWRKEKQREVEYYNSFKQTQFPAQQQIGQHYPYQPTQQTPAQPQQHFQQRQQHSPQQNIQYVNCPICQNPIPQYSNPCPRCGRVLNW